MIWYYVVLMSLQCHYIRHPTHTYIQLHFLHENYILSTTRIKYPDTVNQMAKIRERESTHPIITIIPQKSTLHFYFNVAILPPR
jgi:hypothetical protein